jgi:hypothetical protein
MELFSRFSMRGLGWQQDLCVNRLEAKSTRQRVVDPNSDAGNMI